MKKYRRPLKILSTGYSRGFGIGIRKLSKIKGIEFDFAALIFDVDKEINIEQTHEPENLSERMMATVRDL